MISLGGHDDHPFLFLVSLLFDADGFCCFAFAAVNYRCSMRNLLSDNLLWYIGTSGKRTLKK